MRLTISLASANTILFILSIVESRSDSSYTTAKSLRLSWFKAAHFGQDTNRGYVSKANAVWNFRTPFYSIAVGILSQVPEQISE